MGSTPRPALGRSLGTLMHGARTTPGAPAPAAVPKTTDISPGMATLLRGPNGSPRASAASPPQPQPDPDASLVRVSLVVADLLICGLVTWMAFASAHPWGLAEGLICGGAITIGAWLTCLALSWNKDR